MGYEFEYKLATEVADPCSFIYRTKFSDILIHIFALVKIVLIIRFTILPIHVIS